MNIKLKILIIVFLTPVILKGKSIITTLPKKIVITDLSFNSYGGKRYEYIYELRLKKTDYKLYQTYLAERNFKKKRKKKTKKYIKNISSSLISELLTELQNKKDSLVIEDLGYSYEWFVLNNEQVFNKTRELWERRWPNSPNWNTYQATFIKKQLKDAKNISYAVQRRFLNQGYVTLHSSSGSKLRVDLFFEESGKKISITANDNYLGLPWIINDKEKYYNQNISDIIYALIPENSGYNKKGLKRQEQNIILDAIINQMYDDKCMRKVNQLSFYNYKKELDELEIKYKLWAFRTERSATNNWDGEYRLFMYARDTTETRHIRLGISLTIDENGLYTRDSILMKGDYYYSLVQQVPFLLEYLDENPKRSIDITFDNGNSLSEKVKEHQSTENSWYNGNCLNESSEDYLNKCVTFVMRDEKGNGSNWLITPELDVILIYYQHSKVYKYFDKDLGLEGPSIRYACKHFDLKGNIKK